MVLNLNNKFLIIFTLFILGIFSSYSLPPYNFFFINFITFPLLFYILVNNINKNFLSLFFYGWIFGFGYFLSNLYWISNSLKFDENFEGLIILSIVFIPFLLSFYYGIFSICLKFLNVKLNFYSILIFSLTFSIVEYLRGNLFGGFPWNLITYSILELTSSLQILNLIGTYSLNLIIITFYCLPIVLTFNISKFRKFAIFLLAFTIILINSYYGNNRIKDIAQTKKKLIVQPIKLISPNFKIERFFIDEPIEQKLNELIQISYPLDKDSLLIYPEGITNIGELNGIDNDFSEISNLIYGNSKIILGITFDDGEKIFNSLALFNKNFELFVKKNVFS